MVELLLETGLPVWLSYRRCRHGVCGVYGQHWGPPEGDLFGRAARRFEEMGVEALLINCLPVDHVPGIVSWLRDFTELPLGVYPNLGHLAGQRWRFDDTIGPEAYAELALGWREEGAQIIGGCCGVTADHIAALGPALAEHQARPPPPAARGAAALGRVAARRARARAVARRARRRPLPAAAPRAHDRVGRVRADAGQLPRLEAPLPARGAGDGHALPRRRLRLRHPDGAARAQRRRARARDRHRPQRRSRTRSRTRTATASATA